jgi:hypothetical protein
MYLEVFFTILNRPREKNPPIIEPQVAKHSAFLKFHEDQTFTVKLRKRPNKDQVEVKVKFVDEWNFLCEKGYYD